MMADFNGAMSKGITDRERLVWPRAIAISSGKPHSRTNHGGSRFAESQSLPDVQPLLSAYADKPDGVCLLMNNVELAGRLLEMAEKDTGGPPVLRSALARADRHNSSGRFGPHRTGAGYTFCDRSDPRYRRPGKTQVVDVGLRQAG